MGLPLYLNRPCLGFGLGLRTTHHEAVLADRPPVDWLEVLSENYLVPGGKPLYYLDRIREHYPMVLHGVSLSIGSTDPLDWNYLKRLKALVKRVEPEWISDHLCWTGVDGKNMHDLFPLPYTEESIDHVVARIDQVQDYFGCQILMENVSSYVAYKQSMMSEWDFLSTVAEQADCLILCDINNVYVSAYNHRFDPRDYIDAIPIERVQQFHIAGHNNYGDYIVDTHDRPVVDPVWDLYAHAVRRFGHVSTMIERDESIPRLEELLAEVEKSRRIAEAIYGKRA